MDTNSFLLRTLIADKLISERDVVRAQERPGDPLESLVNLGVISHRALAITRAKVCEYPFVDLPLYEIEHKNAGILPRALAEKYHVFPLFVFEQTVTVAMLDPLNLQAIDQVRQIVKREVEPVVCDAQLLKGLIARAYSLGQSGIVNKATDASGEKELTTGDEPIVAATQQILMAALEMGASDIHINPDEEVLHLRYRVDGTLRPLQGPPKDMHAGIVQRLKVLAKLDLTQTRKPQDGKFRFSGNNSYVDIRLSTLPTIHGENVVMRLLRSASAVGNVKDLSMPDDMTAWFEESIRKPHGMIVVTGPTGSGKTTTLYTALAAVNSPTRNIMTIEDPVEIRLPLVRQIQVNHEVGLTFASALRSILRQDPNVVLVGEIRDEETAKIANQAALTGHLVLSTLHTNDALGSLPRLKAFGVPGYAINNGLLCCVAQRLAKKVCGQCAVPDSEDAERIASFGLTPEQVSGLRRGSGCPDCGNLGTRGRMAVFEMLRITTRLRALIEHDRAMTEVGAAAALDGFRPMWHDGLRKAIAGRIPLSELDKLKAEIENEKLDQVSASSEATAELRRAA
jgi:type II secretory ATPase GspE/PulE/Tfp pilus assembly ATPase PilB-like protein